MELKVHHSNIAVMLTWDSILKADGYNFFVDDKLVLTTIGGSRTNVTLEKPADGKQHKYSVKPWSYFDVGEETL